MTDQLTVQPSGEPTPTSAETDADADAGEMTAQPVSAEAAETFDEVLSTLVNTLERENLASQDRCVDGLLDLYNAAPNEVIRQLVAGIIDEIRHLSAVKAETILSQLSEVATALAVEMAFA